MKTSEMRSKSSEELKGIVLNSKKELFNLRMQRSAGTLEGGQGFKKARKTIARAKTLLNEAKSSDKDAAPKSKNAAGKKTGKE